MEKIESYIKKPARGLVVFWVVALVLSLIGFITRGNSYAPYHHNITIMFPILSALVLFITGRKYVVDRSGISVYLLGIKIQTVTWSNIREICIVHQKALGEGDYRVYVVREGSPYIGRNPDRISLLSLKHPIKILCFMVWDGTIDQCRMAFEHLNSTQRPIVVTIDG